MATTPVNYATPITCGNFGPPTFSPAGATQSIFMGPRGGQDAPDNFATAQQQCLADPLCTGVIYRGTNASGANVFRTMYAAGSPGAIASPPQTTETGFLQAGLPVVWPLTNAATSRRIDCEMSNYDANSCSTSCDPGVLTTYQVRTQPQDGGTLCPAPSCNRGACPQRTGDEWRDARNVTSPTPGAYPNITPAAVRGEYGPGVFGQPPSPGTYRIVSPCRTTLAQAQQDCLRNQPNCIGIVATRDTDDSAPQFCQRLADNATGGTTLTLPTTPPQAVGYPVNYPLTNGPAAAVRDCSVSGYTEGACSLPCGPGTRTVSYTTVTTPQNGGTACPATSLSCNRGACPTIGTTPSTRGADQITSGAGAYPSSTPGSYFTPGFRPALPIPILNTSPATYSSEQAARSACDSNPSCVGLVQTSSSPITYVLAGPGGRQLNAPDTAAGLTTTYDPIYTPYMRPNTVTQATTGTPQYGTQYMDIYGATPRATLAEAQQDCLRSSACAGVTVRIDAAGTITYVIGAAPATAVPASQLPSQAGYPIAIPLNNKGPATPVNCSPGPMQTSTCSFCGNETKYTYYIPTVLPTNGGTACPLPQTTTACTNGACPNFIDPTTKQVITPTTNVTPGGCSYTLRMGVTGDPVGNTTEYNTLAEAMTASSRDADSQGVFWDSTKQKYLLTKRNGTNWAPSTNTQAAVFEESTSSPSCKRREPVLGSLLLSPCTAPGNCGTGQRVYSQQTITAGLNMPPPPIPAPISCQLAVCPFNPTGLTEATVTGETTITDGTISYTLKVWKTVNQTTGIFRYQIQFIPNVAFTGTRQMRINASIANRGEIQADSRPDQTTGTATQQIYHPGNRISNIGAQGQAQLSIVLESKYTQAGLYTIQFDITFPISNAKTTLTTSDTLNANIFTGTCANNQVYSQATNSCINITLPPLPPNTQGPLSFDDVDCPQGQGEDCPIVYRVPPGSPGAITSPLNEKGSPTTYSTTNPCQPPQQYSFVTNQCIATRDYCCRYSDATAAGSLTQAQHDAAIADPRCTDRVTSVANKTALCSTDNSARARQCCLDRNKGNPTCRSYWQIQYQWKQGQAPQGCQNASAALAAGFTDYAPKQTNLAATGQGYTLFDKPIQQPRRSFNLKSFFKV